MYINVLQKKRKEKRANSFPYRKELNREKTYIGICKSLVYE